MVCYDLAETVKLFHVEQFCRPAGQCLAGGRPWKELFSSNVPRGTKWISPKWLQTELSVSWSRRGETALATGGSRSIHSSPSREGHESRPNPVPQPTE